MEEFLPWGIHSTSFEARGSWPRTRPSYLCLGHPISFPSGRSFLWSVKRKANRMANQNPCHPPFFWKIQNTHKVEVWVCACGLGHNLKHSPNVILLHFQFPAMRKVKSKQRSPISTVGVERILTAFWTSTLFVAIGVRREKTFSRDFKQKKSSTFKITCWNCSSPNRSCSRSSSCLHIFLSL